MSRPRVVLLADQSRPDIADISAVVRKSITRYAEVAAELPADGDPLPAELDVELAVVVGGDGTLIRQARRVADRRLPLIGVNVGRLGFLAKFDARSLAEHAREIFGPDPPVHEHMLLATTVRNADAHVTREDVAVNDCVISAGEPFRIIELRLSIDGVPGPTLTGDGVIVATPIGSTAYNVSAGGPIVHPTLEAMVITPLAAHSLAFRPVVVRADCFLRVDLVRTNAGTTLVQDGQATSPLRPGDCVEIRRHASKARFVANPATTYWHILQEKLRWAAPPTYRDGSADAERTGAT